MIQLVKNRLLLSVVLVAMHSGLTAPAFAAVSVWLSEVGTVGGGFVPGNAILDVAPGQSKSMYVWMRNTTRMRSVSLDLTLSTQNFMEITGVEIFNADVLAGGVTIGTRWNDPVSNGTIAPDGFSIENFAAVSVDTLGLDVATRAFDELYDPLANAALFARIDFHSLHTGSTAVQLSEGATKIVEAGNPNTPELHFGSATVNSFAPETSEIEVSSNGLIIPDNDATPSLADNTDFGAVSLGSIQERTFQVRDLRFGTDLQTPVFSGPFFLVGDFPTDVAPDQTLSFPVGLDTSALGSYSGGISFGTNNQGQNPYNFALAAQVVPEPAFLGLITSVIVATAATRRRLS
jgi:hypothetical protein